MRKMQLRRLVSLYLGILSVFTLASPIIRGEMFDTPYREVAIVATSEGFYPKSIQIFEGERVKFFLTGIGDKPLCFVIPEQSIFLSASLGKVSEGVGYFKNPGIVKFNCPSGKIEGKVVVLPKRKKIERKTASTRKVVRVWRPKDVPTGLAQDSEESADKEYDEEWK